MKFTRKSEDRRLVIRVRIILKWILNIQGVEIWTGSVALIVLVPSSFHFIEDLKDVCPRGCPALTCQDVGFSILTAPLNTVHFIHTDRFLGIMRVLGMRKEAAE
jgi:hypothetical protein